MKKQLILPAYLIVEIIFYFLYPNDGNLFVVNWKIDLSIWIICILVNTYLLYVLLPGYLKRSMKRKSIGLKILFYIALVIAGDLITIIPVELILGVPITSSF